MTDQSDPTLHAQPVNASAPKGQPNDSTKKGTSTPWPQGLGLGAWNLYFLGKFALAAAGYLTLNALWNALLFVGLIFPVRSRLVNRVRHVLGLVAAVALLWSESYLPAPDVIAKNAGNLAGFSAAYLRELIVGFVNPEMVLWGLVGAGLWYVLRDWFRFTTVTVIGLLVVAFPQLTSLLPSSSVNTTGNATSVVASSALTTDGALSPAQTQKADTEGISAWVNAFYDYEKTRKATFPAGAVDVAKSGAFDIVLINICSLANDDVVAAGLEKSPEWERLTSRMDVRFTNFNTATSYSGPATLRLMTGVCGQPSHAELYEGRRENCELLGRLAKAGWTEQLFMDHDGKYDDYLTGLRTLGGLSVALGYQSHYHKGMESFDGSPIYDTRDVFKSWEASLPKTPSRTVTLMNLVTLHDGARDPASQDPIDFKPRAQTLFAEINALMDRVAASKRKVLFVVVPEHGAALRGDKIQVAKLREIPSPLITHVPVMVKFFGLDGAQPSSPLVVDTPTSYLALSELIGRTVDNGVYADAAKRAEAKDDNTQRANASTVATLIKDLPQTWPVSSNSSATVVDDYQGKTYLRLKEGKWLEYKQ